jgi:hypothetical protein
LYLFLLEFFKDGLFLPGTQACTTLLLQHAGSRSSSTLPPREFLTVLATIFSSLDRLKDLFNAEFVSVLSPVPNALPVCRDCRKRAVKAIEDSARDAMHAWCISIVSHVERLLISLQSKYDYSPKNELGINMGRSGLQTGASIACTNACKALAAIHAAVGEQVGALDRLNLRELFWRPLGQQVVGLLISHVRKTVVDREGAPQLIRDIDEYCNVS